MSLSLYNVVSDCPELKNTSREVNNVPSSLEKCVVKADYYTKWVITGHLILLEDTHCKII